MICFLTQFFKIDELGIVNSGHLKEYVEASGHLWEEYPCGKGVPWIRGYLAGMLSAAKYTQQCSCVSSLAVFSGTSILLSCLQPSLLLWLYDCRMVARVGGTQWFGAAVHQAQGKNQASQVPSPASQPYSLPAGAQGPVLFLD